MDLNFTVQSGRLTRDVELTYVNDKPLAKFTLANDKWGDGTNFFNCSMWGKNAENLAKFSHKGSWFVVVGRLDHRTWESDNGKRSATELVANDFILPPKPKIEGHYVEAKDDKDEFPF